MSRAAHARKIEPGSADPSLAQQTFLGFNATDGVSFRFEIVVEEI